MSEAPFDEVPGPAAELSSADAEAAAVRRPPQSIESEQCVIGGLMLNNNAYDLVADLLTPDDFYRRDHRLIYETIAQMLTDAKGADVVTVYGELQSMGKAEEAGGLAYLNSLVNSTPSAANIRRYAEIVRDRSVLRQLVDAGDRIASMALAPQAADVSQVLDTAQSLVFAIDEKTARTKKGFRKVNDIVADLTAEVQKLYQQKSNSLVTGLSTGFLDLDRMTAGLQKGDLIIVAGRPSMGKTSFAMNLAEQTGFKDKMPVAVFSMEMSSVQIVRRMVSSIGRIDAQALRRGRLDNDDWERYGAVIDQFSKVAFYVDDTPGLTVSDLRARARRLARRTGGLSLIVVDYLQLMTGSSSGGRSENRATEISEISRGLKGLAKELDVPVIALSQLNRGVDSRENKRPVMSDLRESGAIEQDADMILFIYRDEVYNKETPDKNVAEIIIGKQRNGPIGTVRLRFDGQYTRFDNLEQPQQSAA